MGGSYPFLQHFSQVQQTWLGVSGSLTLRRDRVQDDMGGEGPWDAEIQVNWSGMGMLPMEEMMT